jgi:hypothetical protein
MTREFCNSVQMYANSNVTDYVVSCYDYSKCSIIGKVLR